MSLQEIGKGWEFCFMPEEEFPWIGSGKRWNPIMGCPRLAEGRGCSDPSGEEYCYLIPMNKRMGDLIYIRSIKIDYNKLEQSLGGKPSIVAIGTSGDIWAWESFLLNNESQKYRQAVKKILWQINKSQHFPLFLTKNPENYSKFTILEGEFGYGTTVCYKEDFWRIDELRKIKGDVLRWVIFEPCFLQPEDCDGLNLDGIDWVIVGGLNGKNSKKYELSYKTLSSLCDECLENFIPIYIKKGLDRQFNDIGYTGVWDEDTIDTPKQFPAKILRWAEEVKGAKKCEKKTRAK